MKEQSDQPRHAVHDMPRDGASCIKTQRSTLHPDPCYSMRRQRNKKGRTEGANANGARKDETIPRGHAIMPNTSLKRLEETAYKTGAGEEKLRLCVAAKRKGYGHPQDRWNAVHAVRNRMRLAAPAAQGAP